MLELWQAYDSRLVANSLSQHPKQSFEVEMHHPLTAAIAVPRALGLELPLLHFHPGLAPGSAMLNRLNRLMHVERFESSEFCDSQSMPKRQTPATPSVLLASAFARLPSVASSSPSAVSCCFAREKRDIVLGCTFNRATQTEVWLAACGQSACQVRNK